MPAANPISDFVDDYSVAWARDAWHLWQRGDTKAARSLLIDLRAELAELRRRYARHPAHKPISAALEEIGLAGWAMCDAVGRDADKRAALDRHTRFFVACKALEPYADLRADAVSNSPPVNIAEYVSSKTILERHSDGSGVLSLRDVARECRRLGIPTHKPTANRLMVHRNEWLSHHPAPRKRRVRRADPAVSPQYIEAATAQIRAEKRAGKSRG